MQDEVVFDAKLPCLSLMLQWIRSKLRPLALSSSDKNKLELVAEEILVNIIHYAYQDKEGKIEIVWIQKPSLVYLVFKDFGTPFNPLLHEKPPIKSLSIDSKEVGGLGIFFMKNLIDKIDYRYENSANILTISKKIA
ncbi:MAG: ATP-binding protein [Chlamydiae bacterium]|nr:ATP-binding protein [Chlamydiota bacterium]